VAPAAESYDPAPPSEGTGTAEDGEVLTAAAAEAGPEPESVDGGGPGEAEYSVVDGVVTATTPAPEVAPGEVPVTEPTVETIDLPPDAPASDTQPPSGDVPVTEPTVETAPAEQTEPVEAASGAETEAATDATSSAEPAAETSAPPGE